MDESSVPTGYYHHAQRLVDTFGIDEFFVAPDDRKAADLSHLQLADSWDIPVRGGRQKSYSRTKPSWCDDYEH